MEELLKIENLSVSIASPAGTVQAVRDVSFSLYPGEVLAIVGESGCGKSILCKFIMKLLPKSAKIDSGRVLANGVDITNYSERDMRKLRGKLFSMIFQDPMTTLNPTIPIGRQIAEAILIHEPKLGKEAVYNRVIELMELVGIQEPKQRYCMYPYNFSGGMRQRSVMAIALAANPRILLADEPTTALDVTIQAQILELMMELKDKLGMAIILITHDLGVVASMCEKVAVMYAGHIVEYGTVDDIFYHPKHEYTKGLLRSIPRLDAEEHERLVPIEGTPIDMLNPPKGCPFAPRCDKCMKICLRQMPPITEFDDIHYTQCWMNQKEQMQGGTAE